MKFYVAIVCVAFATVAYAVEIPSFLPRCKYGENECISTAINSWLKLAKDGNKEINLPPFDPLFVERANIIQDPTSNIAIKLTLRDIYVRGLNKAEAYKTVGFEQDISKSKFEVHAKVPKIVLNSKYVVDGKVLILPITGNGDAVLVFDDADIKLKMKLEPYEKNGETYAKVSKFKIAFTIGKFNIKLDNLFNGNKALSDNMNNFINENWEIIFQELKPAISNTLGKIITNIITQMMDVVPYRNIYSNGK